MKNVVSIPLMRAAAILGVALGLFAPTLLGGHGYAAIAYADQKDEEAMGDAAAKEVAKQAKFCTDEAVNKRVADVGAKIAAVALRDKLPARFGNDQVYAFKYTYTVIESKEINAFALPGGHVYIYRGLLNLLHTDDELAGVLGHETTHASHHHIPELMHEAGKLSTQMLLGVLVSVLAKVPPNQIADVASAVNYMDQAVLNNHFSEAAEEDADHTGMLYMQRAGFDPVAMLTMLERLKSVEDVSPQIDLGYLQDHPLTPQRIDAAKQELSTLGISVDTEALRKAAGAIHAKVADASGTTQPAIRVTIGQRTVALLAPSNRAEADAAAAQLNLLLDNNLRNDQVRATDNEVIAGGKVLVTFTPADIKVQPVAASADQLAISSKSEIQRALFDIEMNGIAAK